MTGPAPAVALLGRLPWGLLGMIALTAAVEAFIAGRGPDFRSTADWGWAVTGKAARVEGPGRDVLVFGDSLVKLGVAPGLVAVRSGRSTYNLALCGGQAPSTYFLLRRALDAGARPSAVLVDFFPRLQQLGPRHGIELWPALLGPIEAVELAWVARDPDLLASILVARALPSVRARHALRSSILAALDGRPSPSRDATRAYRRNWRKNLGAQIMPCGVDPDGDFARVRRDFFSDLDFDPVNVAFMERFLALAASRGIPVYYLVPPMKPGLQAECERSGFDASYVAFLEGIRSRYPNVVMVDARHAAFDPALFYDPNHLGRDGAWAYSIALGDLLARRPPGSPGPRWVEVPGFRGLPGGAPPEDVNQSSVSILAGDRPGLIR